jgi:hypothetical protein
MEQMKSLCTLFFVIFFTSCQIISGTNGSESKSPSNQYPLEIKRLKIGSQEFEVIQNDPREEDRMNLVILDSHKDTVYTHDGFASNGFEFEDFDENGIFDIRLFHVSNVSGISELIFFDRGKQTFRAIENFVYFPSPKKIKGTNYWYSYHRSGCGDQNWGSDMFKIKNYKAIKLADMEGIGYSDVEREYGIFVYRTNGDSRELIFSEPREPGYYSDKWEFMEKYWHENYAYFE